MNDLFIFPGVNHPLGATDSASGSHYLPIDSWIFPPNFLKASIGGDFFYKVQVSYFYDFVDDISRFSLSMGNLLQIELPHFSWILIWNTTIYSRNGDFHDCLELFLTNPLLEMRSFPHESSVSRYEIRKSFGPITIPPSSRQHYYTILGLKIREYIL